MSILPQSPQKMFAGKFLCRPVIFHQGTNQIKFFVIKGEGQSKILFWGNLFRKKRFGMLPFWNCLVRSQAAFMWRHSVRLEIGGKEKNLKLTWYTSQGQQNLFFQAIIHFTIFSVIISVVKRLVGSHLDKVSPTEWRHENVPRLLSTVQNGGNNVQSLGFFGEEFPKENLHFRGSNFGEWLNLMQSWQKIYVFWRDLSFKN